MKPETFPEVFPKIETARLVLRQPMSSDEDMIYALYRDPEVVHGRATPIETRAEAEHLLRTYMDDFTNHERILWTITEKTTLAPIGTVSYEAFDAPGLGQIGYDLLPTRRGSGYVHEALEPVIQYGFDELGLREIEAIAPPGDNSSLDVLNRLGFTAGGEKDGHQRLTLTRPAA